MDIKELAFEAAKYLSNKKATDVNLIEIGTKAAFADYFVNATAGSQRQVETLSDYIEDFFYEKDIEVKNIEGKHNPGWVLLDFGDIIVNIFSQEMRDKYCLEKIWGECPIIQVEE